MKRLFSKLVLLLIAGALVSVAVAWGCAIWVPGDFRSDQRPDINLYRRLVPLDKRLIGTGSISPGISKWTLEWRHESGWSTNEDHLLRLPDWMSREICARIKDTTCGTAIVIDARGWPYACAYSVADVASGRILFGYELVAQSESASKKFMNNFALPVAPIWSHFLFNTLIFAAMLWLLQTVGRSLRWCHRLKRGLCPACAYPIGTSPVCTECGKALT